MKLPPRGTRPRRWVRAAPALTVALFALVLASFGCASSSAPKAAQVRAAYEEVSPGCRLEHEERLTLSGLKLAVVKRLVRLSNDEDAVGMLSNLRRVEVATYRVVTPEECAEVGALDRIKREMMSSGWRPMVIERDRLEASWVFSHSDAEEGLDGLFVVTIDAGELEVVRLEGRIDRLLADAVADDPDHASVIADLAR